MNQEQIWQELSALPPVARQQVIDFIAFLRGRYTQTETDSEQVQSSLQDEPFIGIWRDYEAMADSGKWVRETRNREWG
ncbi:MAG: hypothetical protein KC419_27455 [Anaerolineales bacterium]|nr:hypothetical protein [Anaerolineales bacterium]MCA9932264.1 hypothetical protein [Anaerolineales bacterium]